MNKKQKTFFLFVFGIVSGFFAAAKNDIKTISPSGPAYAHDFMPQDLDLWTCGNWIVYKNRLIAHVGKSEAKRIIKNDLNRTSFEKLPYFNCADDSAFFKEMAQLGGDFKQGHINQNI